MGRAYKNFWALNTDEAVVTAILRDYFKKKQIEVFMPLNAQMKDIDLALMNLKTRKVITIQVKGSKGYEPRVTDLSRFGQGSLSWFAFKKEYIENASADYFVFLSYVLCENANSGRRDIVPHIVTIPTCKLKEMCTLNKHTNNDGKYNFYFWINPEKNSVQEFRDREYILTEYLDERGLQILNRDISQIDLPLHKV